MKKAIISAFTTLSLVAAFSPTTFVASAPSASADVMTSISSSSTIVFAQGDEDDPAIVVPATGVPQEMKDLFATIKDLREQGQQLFTQLKEQSSKIEAKIDIDKKAMKALQEKMQATKDSLKTLDEQIKVLKLSLDPVKALLEQEKEQWNSVEQFEPLTQIISLKKQILEERKDILVTKQDITVELTTVISDLPAN